MLSVEEVVAVAAIDRTLVLLLISVINVLACSEGGLRITDPALDGHEPASNQTGSDTDHGASDESEGSLDEGPLDESEGPFDEGSLDEGSLDTGDEENSVFVAPDGIWRFATSESIGDDWATPEFDDLGWSSGAAPLGHGMPITTEVPSSDGQPTAWFRASFDLADPTVIAGLDLRLRRDDGAIAYLNGVEVLRTNMPSGAIGPTTRSETEAQGGDEHRYMRAFPDIALLRVGVNVLAVEIHDRETNPEDRVIDALLQSVDPDVPPDELEFRVRTLTYDSSKYGPRNVGAIWIETQDGSFVRTLEVWGDTRREHLLAWRVASDENDVDAVTASTMKTHATHVATWDLTDLDGQPVEPGSYRLRVEFTEDNSNDNAKAGPQIDLAFDLDGIPERVHTPSSGDADAFTDLLLWSP